MLQWTRKLCRCTGAESCFQASGERGCYTEAADITLNEAPSQETGQYKTLNTDGTYSATKFDVKATVTDASAQIQAPSIWGDYMLVVKEVGTKYLRNSRQGDFAVGGNTLE